MSDQTIDLAAPLSAEEKPPEEQLAERYIDQGRIAIGGMGEVRRVHDPILKRTLAMKIIRWSLLQNPEAQRRFTEEARITAQLQHPGIVAIHDTGTLADGRLWYTMPVIHGATFTDALAGMQRSDGSRWSTWNRHRLLSAFHRASSAVAYAHSQGVIHRDLKPDNIMIGSFDEIMVMDWGIAALREALAGAEGPARILGTPAYMPPEQASGESALHGPASDVYALGVCLFELLTGTLPWQERGDGLLATLRHGSVPAYTIPDGLPPALTALITSALKADPAQRPTDAAAFSDALQAWLDGSSRRQRALTIVDEADRLLPTIAQTRRRADTLLARATAMLAPLSPHDPISKKAPAWALQDQAHVLQRTIAQTETRYLQTLRTALSHDPDLDEAHTRLATLFYERIRAAEQRGDDETVVRLEVDLRAHDRGRYAGFLTGSGTLTLHTSQPATATLLRHVPHQRKLVPTPFDRPLSTPILDERLPAGSYLVRLESPDCEVVHYPILIRRGEAWRTTPPGAYTPLPVHLPPTGTIAEDEAFVPGGWFLSGGDSEAIDSLPPRWLWIDDLVVCRAPVTNREYIAWLDALWDAGRHDEARRHCPGSHHTEAESSHVYIQSPDGRFHPGSVPGNWALDAPVVLVDHASAMAYAAHRAEVTGQPWRLLHDQEWEKAARGVDGRHFPWGDHFDPRRTCMARSTLGKPARTEIASFPDDTSPYGVRGMGGNVRDWCLNPYRARGPASEQITVADHTDGDARYRMSRGGSWSSSNDTLCRAASRFAGSPTQRLVSLGFRLGRSLDDPFAWSG